MDNVEPESDYIIIHGGIINAAYLKSLGVPVRAVQEFVRRLAASDERIIGHLQSREMSVPDAWEFLRRLGKVHSGVGVGTQIEATVLDFMLSGLAGGSDTAPSGTAGSADGPGRTQVGKVRGKKPGVNARMLETIQQDTESMGWSSTNWAKHLKCAKSSVVATQAWQDLAMGRDRVKAERARDRGRRPKGSARRRD